MLKVVLTETFEKWLDGLRDPSTRRRLVLRLRKASLGQLGDVKPVSLGVLRALEQKQAGEAAMFEAIKAAQGATHRLADLGRGVLV